MKNCDEIIRTGIPFIKSRTLQTTSRYQIYLENRHKQGREKRRRALDNPKPDQKYHSWCLVLSTR